MVTNTATGETIPLSEFTDAASEEYVEALCRSLDRETDEFSAVIVEETAIKEIAARYDLSESDADAVLGVWKSDC